MSSSNTQEHAHALPAAAGHKASAFLVRYEWAFVIAGFLCLFVLFGTSLPIDFDSTSYALAISTDFDIAKNQPHPPGNLFYVAAARLAYFAIGNPLRTVELLNVAFLTVLVLILTSARQRKPLDLLFAASTPLFLFFCCAPEVYGVSVATGAVCAFLIAKMREGSVNPLILVTTFFICTGLRQDTFLFMGPVVALAILLKRCSRSQWLAFAVIGCVVTAAWYFPTQWFSTTTASTAAEFGKGYTPFLSTFSVFFGAPLFENARVALRFYIFAIGVLGPGGIAFLCSRSLRFRGMDAVIALVAAAPLLLYGTFAYIGYPYHYASVLGFILVWSYVKNGLCLPRSIAAAGILANVLFFLLIPPAIYKGDTFAGRPLSASIIKQASYMGSNGRRTLGEAEQFGTFVDTTLSKCNCFRQLDCVGWNGMGNDRMWRYLSRQRWHNRFVEQVDSAAETQCTRIYYIDRHPNESPDARFENIGISFPKGNGR
jgi:hypothetical protein